MTIYTKYADIPFNEVDISPFNKAYIQYMMDGIHRGIENVHARIEVILLNGQLIPYSVKDGDKNASWIHSFTGQYIDEMISEVNRMEMPNIVRSLAHQLLNVGRTVLGLTGEKTVTVFPSFMSTTMYEDFQFDQLQEITRILVARFPKHAIIYRTLNDKFHQDKMKQLDDVGYEAMISRAIYIFDPDDKHTKNERKDLKKDMKRFEKSGLTFTYELREDEFHQLMPLYKQVYLDKYSDFNPHYTEDFFKFLYKEMELTWFILKDNERIVSFMGVSQTDNVLFPAYFGMDQSVKGLYFMTSGLLYHFAKEYGYKINNSAGAKDYKLARGSRPYLEYHYIYYKHLKLIPFLSYALFTKVATPLGKFLLEKLQFK
ncbi:GNAT family N-acetyltransferase [Macrococcus epidermidis]|uniref:peptidogalycan biosysnthesis protein n=1 Tax=Macrococcus epidermidis TaxID=1902580 RepID=UPI001EF33FB4|nr:peptidogalycan biosysnthesis protein [Macrococcus epidermidis]MCG7420571.1 GNAT family N-acetyltransferase [Macrococcus epidermidis]